MEQQQQQQVDNGNLTRRRKQNGSWVTTTTATTIEEEEDEDRKPKLHRPAVYLQRLLSSPPQRHWYFVGLIFVSSMLLIMLEREAGRNILANLRAPDEFPRRRHATTSLVFSNDFRSTVLDMPLYPYYFSTVQTAMDRFYKGLKPLELLIIPDYGSLKIPSMVLTEFHRDIKPNDAQIYYDERREFLYHIDQSRLHSHYDSFEDQTFNPLGCVPPKWRFIRRPNCNVFHEVSLEQTPELPEQTFDIKYLGSGYYRDTFLLQPTTTTSTTTLHHTSIKIPAVLKHLRYNEDFEFNIKNENSIHNEALVMEALSSSNRTSDIYGYCATSILVGAAKDITDDIVPKLAFQKDRGRITQHELDKLQKDDVYPLNNFTAVDKLKIAISMAEALAEMHGHARGVITHDDFHPDQFLIAADNRVILNDINNAVALEWNFAKQEYCKYFASYGGDFRAPEEFTDQDKVDEMVDIWPMGSMIFCLLTGLWPYYTETSNEEIQRLSLQGVRPYIDPRYQKRSLIEQRLVEIMNACHVREPSARPDIFFVVKHLHETLRMHQADLQYQKETEHGGYVVL